jgi:hypothetical protein
MLASALTPLLVAECHELVSMFWHENIYSTLHLGHAIGVATAGLMCS